MTTDTPPATPTAREIYNAASAALDAANIAYWAARDATDKARAAHSEAREIYNAASAALDAAD